jgi:hypothetical protein
VISEIAGARRSILVQAYSFTSVSILAALKALRPYFALPANCSLVEGPFAGGFALEGAQEFPSRHLVCRAAEHRSQRGWRQRSGPERELPGNFAPVKIKEGPGLRLPNAGQEVD